MKQEITGIDSLNGREWRLNESELIRVFGIDSDNAKAAMHVILIATTSSEPFRPGSYTYEGLKFLMPKFLGVKTKHLRRESFLMWEKEYGNHGSWILECRDDDKGVAAFEVMIDRGLPREKW